MQKKMNTSIQFMLSLILAFIAVNAQSQCVQSSVANDYGQTSVYVCTADGNADEITFTSSNIGTANYNYVITDDQNNILGLPPGNSLDFEGVPAGTCRVWGLSYEGNITAAVGDNAAAVDLSDACFQLSDNFITVARFDDIFAGQVVTDGGDTEISVCVGDTNDNVVTFGNYEETDNPYTYIVTDDAGNILAITSTNVNFNGAPAGVCLVYGLSYTGNLTAQAGNNIHDGNLADGCYDVTDNHVEVTRTAVDGGFISLTNGETTYNGTAGDIVIDVMHTTTANVSYWYIITDANDNILATHPSTVGSTLDLSGAPAGECHIWGWSYTGLDDPIPGEHISSLNDDECETISNNRITVIRSDDSGCMTDGGTVAMPSGATERLTCPGDGLDDIVMFTHETGSDANYTYVITDEAGNILGLPPTNSQNFEGAGEGVCLVWGLSYTGTITAQAGDNALAIALTDGCFALSENFITVTRANPDGGSVSGEDSAATLYTCTGDGTDDFLSFSHETNSAANYAYVVTDDQNNILGLPPGSMVNFEGAPAGTCRVWGLSYTGNVTAQVGDNAAAIALTDGCFELSSNYVEVVRTDGSDIFAGQVVTDGGDTEITLCVGDTQDNVVTFGNYEESDNPYTYIVTDEDGNILAVTQTNVNFNGAPAGICFVYGLSYTGTVTAQVGNNIYDGNLADGCHDLTDNHVEVNRIGVDGGTISLANGETTYTGTAGDIVIDVMHTTTASVSYWYIITDANDNILATHPSTAGSTLDLSGAPAGECHIWGWSYTGLDDPIIGEHISSLNDDECETISDNWITVIRSEDTSCAADGGTLAGGPFEFCVGDGEADFIAAGSIAVTPGTGTNATMVITDYDGTILGLPPTVDAIYANVNFDGAGDGTCLIYRVAYEDVTGLEMGANVNALEGCFDLSNSIEVIRAIPDGGTVVTDFGETDIDLCVGDGESDYITFGNYDESGNTYTYVVTDADDNVLAYTMTGIDFDGAPAGQCHVWGLSYIGELNMETGVNIFDIEFTDGCFALSTNFVTVNRYSGDDCNSVNPLALGTANDATTATTKTASTNEVSNKLALNITPTQLDILLAPNPTVDYLTISWTVKVGSNDEAQIAIYTIDGKRVYQNQMSVIEGFNQMEVDVNSFQAGLYLVLINDGTVQTARKFLKQ